MRVLVLGGFGFLGRHVVASLLARNHSVVIGSRRAARHSYDDPAAGAHERRETRFERLTSPDAWAPLLGDVDAVVNCVGILRESGRATYERVHLVAPAALAMACAEAGIRRVVHVSALGLHRHAQSRFILSKLRGEIALRRGPVPCTIVRPSLLEGPGGYGSRWLRRAASWPMHFIPADAVGRIAVVDVRDVADAIAVVCGRPPPRRYQTLELGGRGSFTIGEYLAMLRQIQGNGWRARTVIVPAKLARIVAHACDFLHATAFSFGHLELLGRDNVPAMNTLSRLLERAPHGLGSALVMPSGWDTVRQAIWTVKASEY
ncbi:MAG TPA: NAD-dependent epimerase/dehydratase family protein [Casimicrobiaceae bacterium]